MELKDSCLTFLPWRSMTSRDRVVHHDLGHLVTGTAPDIDDLVVALTVGHQTVGVLVSISLTSASAAAMISCFLAGTSMSSEQKEMPARVARRIAVLHQLVGEDDGFLEAAATEGLVDQLGDFLLLQRLVDDLERQALRQDLGQQRTTGGGFDAVTFSLPFAVDRSFVLGGAPKSGVKSSSRPPWRASFRRVGEIHALRPWR
jgi:hypothetical protein